MRGGRVTAGGIMTGVIMKGRGQEGGGRVMLATDMVEGMDIGHGGGGSSAPASYREYKARNAGCGGK